MGIKCNDPDRLIQTLQIKFGVLAENPTIGKYVLRIDDVICNVFSNGTVNFQGKVNTYIHETIASEISHINGRSS